VVSDSTGQFPIGEVHPVDFVKSMMNYGWTPYQQEGKNLILRKQNPQKNGGKKESFLELALT
jgi:hypothetical protein